MLEEYRVIGETELEREIDAHGGSKVAAMEYLDTHAVRIRSGWRYKRTVGLIHAQERTFQHGICDILHIEMPLTGAIGS